MKEEKKKIGEKKPDKGTVTKGLDLKDENSMYSWFKKADDAVQMFLEGDKTVAVRQETIEVNYEVFSIKGATAKIAVHHFDNQPLKVNELGHGITKTGNPKVAGDEADLYMAAWTVNKVNANADDKISRDNFWKLKQFVQEIVFGQNKKLRESPPAGISKSTMTAIKFSWESHKYKVIMSKEAYRKLEENINKKLKKFMKSQDNDILRKAESELVKILQKSMKLKPQMFASSKGFSNYFTVMFDGMFPNDFGTDTRIKALKERKEW